MRRLIERLRHWLRPRPLPRRACMTITAAMWLPNAIPFAFTGKVEGWQVLMLASMSGAIAVSYWRIVSDHFADRGEWPCGDREAFIERARAEARDWWERNRTLNEGRPDGMADVFGNLIAWRTGVAIDFARQQIPPDYRQG